MLQPSDAARPCDRNNARCWQRVRHIAPLPAGLPSGSEPEKAGLGGYCYVQMYFQVVLQGS